MTLIQHMCLAVKSKAATQDGRVAKVAQSVAAAGARLLGKTVVTPDLHAGLLHPPVWFSCDLGTAPGRDLFWRGEVGHEPLWPLALLLVPDSICIDVGAGAGEATLLAARIASLGQVVALEPDPSQVAQLEANIELNRLGPPDAGLAPITVLPVFTSETQLTQTFLRNCCAGAWASSGTVLPLDQLAKGLSLGSVGLVRIAPGIPVLPTLEGAELLLAESRPIVTLTLTAAPGPERGDMALECLSRMTSHGYSMYLVTDYISLPFDPTLLNNPLATHLVCVPLERASVWESLSAQSVKYEPRSTLTAGRGA